MVAEVELINLDERVVHMTDGAVIPVLEFNDDSGVECEPNNAVTCIAGTPEYGYLTIAIFSDPVFLN